MTTQEYNERSYSPQEGQDNLFNTDHRVYEFDAGSDPRLQLVKPSYPGIQDETVYDLGMLSTGQPLSHSGLALNLQYLGQQYLIPQNKEDSLELEDYVQGLNDRFEIPNDQMLPMTPRCSFDQDGALRTDNTLMSNFSPSQKELLPSPATSDMTPPRSQLQDIYSHGLSPTHLNDMSSIPPPFVQKTPMGPVPYNPHLPVFAQMYTAMTPQQHHHVQTASMADITSSPISRQRFPTPPQSLRGELLQSPVMGGRSISPQTMGHLSSSPGRHTSPDSDEYSASTSNYGSPQRRTIGNFDTPPFSPLQFAPPSFAAHLQPKKRGHARGYSTTSIMTNTTFATDASSPGSSSECDVYIHDGPVKSRGTRQTQIPNETMASFIAGPEGRDGKYTCLYPECGKRFGRKYNIQSHIQTHLSDRPYRCDVCRAGFVRQHDLRRHEKIHGGDKPFVCACKKSFARQDALTRHRQRGICSGAFPDAIASRRDMEDKKRRRRSNVSF